MTESGELGSVGRWMGLRRKEVGDGVIGRIAIAEHTRAPGGGLRTGVLLSAIDATGGLACGLASLPAWIVSTNLMVRVARLDHVGPLRLDAHILRKGRAAAVASIDVRDEGVRGQQVAHAILTTTVLDPEAGPPHLDRPVRLRPAPPATPPQPVEAWLGIEAGAGSTTTLHVRDDLRNRWGILHGGVIAALADVAAVRAVGHTARSADTVLHFLQPVRTGPLEARCTTLGTRLDATVVTISMHDLGNAQRRVALASVTVRSEAAKGLLRE